MKPEMYFQTSMGREVFVTYTTFVWFKSSVCAYVWVKSTLHSEGTKTLYTLVGFLVWVDTSVSDQITRLLELLGTVGTLMPGHIPNLYNNKHVHHYQPFIAQVTLILIIIFLFKCCILLLKYGLLDSHHMTWAF